MTYGVNSTLNVFFYGTYLKHKDGDLDLSYQADAISGMIFCMCMCVYGCANVYLNVMFI